MISNDGEFKLSYDSQLLPFQKNVPFPPAFVNKFEMS